MSSARTIVTARALARAYLNPDLAACRRAEKARTQRGRAFWVSVGRMLYHPPACASVTLADQQRLSAPGA